MLVISYMNYTSSKIERFDHGNSAALPKEHLKVISQKNVYYENVYYEKTGELLKV